MQSSVNMTVGRSDWDVYVHVQNSVVRARLNSVRLSDADLLSVLTYMNELLMWRQFRTYSLDIDLSCNSNITDFGVINYLVPFLKKWPHCRRMKLYQTSIGDAALQALSHWVAGGFVHELHLSHLWGQVTGEGVINFLNEIRLRGKYPVPNKRGFSPLWLRLEHNGIYNTNEVVSKLTSAGMSLAVLNKSDLTWVRPGGALQTNPHEQIPQVNLVLFYLQMQRPIYQSNDPSQWPGEDNSEGPLVKQPDVADVELIHKEDTVDQSSGKALGQQILGMLHSYRNGATHREPQPLSTDEFKLRELESRESKESGADKNNLETFGLDCDDGWTFEENLEANKKLASQVAESVLLPDVEHADPWDPVYDTLGESHVTKLQFSTGFSETNSPQSSWPSATEMTMSSCSSRSSQSVDGHVTMDEYARQDKPILCVSLASALNAHSAPNPNVQGAPSMDMMQQKDLDFRKLLHYADHPSGRTEQPTSFQSTIKFCVYCGERRGENQIICYKCGTQHVSMCL